MYLAPREEWYYCVVKITATFDDNSACSGTGFFVKVGNKYAIFTARHTVDAKYRPAHNMRQSICVLIKLEYRGFCGTVLRTAKSSLIQKTFESPQFINEPND